MTPSCRSLSLSLRWSQAQDTEKKTQEILRFRHRNEQRRQEKEQFEAQKERTNCVTEGVTAGCPAVGRCLADPLDGFYLVLGNDEFVQFPSKSQKNPQDDVPPSTC